jgi:hypothetical protein
LDGEGYGVNYLYINRPTDKKLGVFALSTGTIKNINFENEDFIGSSNEKIFSSYVGGVVADNQGILAYITVQGNYISHAQWVGGLVGKNKGQVSDCSSHGHIQGSRNVGGFIGRQKPAGIVTNSYSDATVQGIKRSDSEKMSNEGGLLGANEGLVQLSYATGAVSGYNTGDNDSGGLVGLDVGGGRIKNSFASGEVTGNHAGGLVGSLKHRPNGGGSHTDGTVNNSYASGKVSGDVNSGGLVGTKGSGMVTNGYYDTDTSGQDDTGKGVPIHTAQMFQQATYSGWDFANTWEIDEGKAYPELIWEEGDGYVPLLKLQEKLRGYDKASDYYDKYKYFDGLTYALGIRNTVRVLQTPHIWGNDLTKEHFFAWDGEDVDFDGLPDCTNDASVCIPTNTPCVHLNAFYNGITGQDTKRCLGPADPMVDDIYNAMIQAHTSIDITTLEPFPDGRFLAAMRNAITWLAVNDRKVTIRVLGGVAIGEYDDNLTNEQLQAKYAANDQAFLQALVRDIPADKAGNITLYVGSMRTCKYAIAPMSKCLSPETKKSTIAYKASWNHSKIIDVDGSISIVGGHNWWTNSYLTSDPISDVSLEVQGSAARNAEPFVDTLWKYICDESSANKNTIATSKSWVDGVQGQECLPHMTLPPITPAKGTTAVMGVGRLGLGIYADARADEPGDQSEIARNAMLSQATSIIRIAQQNLEGLASTAQPFWMTPKSRERNNAAGNIYDILAKFLINKGNLYMVTTNYGAKDAGGDGYYTKTKVGYLADTIKDRVKKLAPTMSKDDINTLLCRDMHLATIQPSTEKTWPDGNFFGNHSKVWITDDQDYYVGSHNIYAANLQEYGYIVGGEIATDNFITQYWNPLWKYSSTTAITGSEVPAADCYFDVKHPNNLTCTGRTVVSANKVEYTGCADGNDDTPATFVTSVSTPIDPSDNECSSYQSGATQDNWTGCGKAELGSQDYTITWGGKGVA